MAGARFWVFFVKLEWKNELLNVASEETLGNNKRNTYFFGQLLENFHPQNETNPST